MSYKYEFTMAFSNLIDGCCDFDNGMPTSKEYHSFEELVAIEICNSISEASMNGREDADEKHKNVRNNVSTMIDAIKLASEML